MKISKKQSDFLSLMFDESINEILYGGQAGDILNCDIIKLCLDMFIKQQI